MNKMRWSVTADRILMLIRLSFGGRIGAGVHPEEVYKRTRAGVQEALTGDPSGSFRTVGSLGEDVPQEVGLNPDETIASLPGMLFFVFQKDGVDRDDLRVQERIFALADRVARECLDMATPGPELL